MPSMTQWYTSDGNAVGTSFDDSSSILSLDNGSEGKTYYCTAKSVLKVPLTELETQFRVPYTPKFAVGPKLVDVGWLPTAFDMCAQAGQTIRLRCGVSSNQVKPSPRLTLLIDDEIVKTGWILANNEYSKGIDYELVYHHIPTYGGNLRFLCRAENEIFPDELRTERDEIIPVQGPPKEALVLKTSDNQPITGSDIAYVGAGSDVLVTCRGNGGVPEIERVTVVCGTSTKTQDGSSATLSLQLPNDFSAMECTCSASYIRDCYGERTQIIKLRPKGSVKSEKPHCQAPVLVQQGTIYGIKVVCTSHNDYPEGDCNFTINKGLPADATSDKTVRHPESTASTGSFTTVCELLVSVEGLDEGSYQFQVEVFPSQQSQVTAMSTFSEWTSGILLNHTQVALAQDCPSGTRVKDGYIMTGTTASCRCQVKLAGYPPGYAQWYTSDGNAVGTSFDDSSSILSLDNGSEGKTFYCTAQSVLKVPQTGLETQFQVPYRPKFVESDDDSDSDNINALSIGLGAGIGLAFLLIIVGVILCVHLRRRPNKATPPKPPVPDSLPPSYDYPRTFSSNASGYLRPQTGDSHLERRDNNSIGREDRNHAPLRESEYQYFGMPVLNPSEASYGQQSQYNFDMSVLNPSEVSCSQQSLQ